MKKHVEDSWHEFLNPEVMRGKLIFASIYIAAFEILKDSIINRIRDFFSSRFDESGPIVGPDYNRKVLQLNRSPVYASLQWLKEMNAIDDDDLARFESIKRCRNELAHEMLQLLATKSKPNCAENFAEMIALLRKIEVWWIVNFEMDVNPDLIGTTVDQDQIVPGPVLTLKLMLDVALEDEDKAWLYYEEFVGHKQ